MKILEIIKGHKEIIILSTIIILWLWYFTQVVDARDYDLAKKDALLQQQIEITQEANKKSSLDTIKDEVIENTKQTEIIKEAMEMYRLKYEHNIWRGRCLEVKGQLELRWETTELSCDNDLEKFSSYNVNKTKEEVGL